MMNIDLVHLCLLHVSKTFGLMCTARLEEWAQERESLYNFVVTTLIMCVEAEVILSKYI
jgi:hypothetical protein